MKGRILLVLLSLAIASLSFAGDKGDGKASCCQAGTKASLTSTTKVKDCTMPCTEAMKAQCPYMKGTKASVRKASMKIASRSKSATKATEAKVVKEKQESASASGKGTD
ncbi:MAG TPA: hypothetical protein VLY03_12150 [Bacteroidota bacterium]|nr:hypothetical protein [Bacteroidota bacterium]